MFGPNGIGLRRNLEISFSDLIRVVLQNMVIQMQTIKQTCDIILYYH